MHRSRPGDSANWETMQQRPRSPGLCLDDTGRVREREHTRARMEMEDQKYGRTLTLPRPRASLGEFVDAGHNLNYRKSNFIDSCSPVSRR